MRNINGIIKAKHLDFTVETSNCKGLTGAALDLNTSLLFQEPSAYTIKSRKPDLKIHDHKWGITLINIALDRSS